jgi:hypothetical protein
MSSRRYRRCPLGLFTGCSVGNSLSQNRKTNVLVAVSRLTSPMRNKLFCGISGAGCAALDMMSCRYRRPISRGSPLHPRMCGGSVSDYRVGAGLIMRTRVFVGCTFLPFLSFLVAFLDAMVFLLVRIAPMGGGYVLICTSWANVHRQETATHLLWNVEDATAGFPRRGRVVGNDVE